MNDTDEKLGITDVLVVKLSGTKSQILRHIYKLKEIYPQDRLNMSPILKNSADAGFHCFINILPNQEPVQRIQAEESTDERANQG
jgi:hypothetical protein